MEALVIIPLVDQKLAMVPLVVEALPRMVLPEIFREPLTVKPLTVVVPETARVPPTDKVFRVVLPDTERELKLPPDLTVKLPLISALFERFK